MMKLYKTKAQMITSDGVQYNLCLLNMSEYPFELTIRQLVDLQRFYPITVTLMEDWIHIEHLDLVGMPKSDLSRFRNIVSNGLLRHSNVKTTERDGVLHTTGKYMLIVSRTLYLAGIDLVDQIGYRLLVDARERIERQYQNWYPPHDSKFIPASDWKCPGVIGE